MKWLNYVFIYLMCFAFIARTEAAAVKKILGSSDSTIVQGLNIIPRPFKAETNGEFFHFNKTTVLLLPPGTPLSSGHIYGQYVNLIAGQPLLVKKHAGSNYIKLSIDPLLVPSNEGYVLEVRNNFIAVTGHDDAGLFYGLQSLTQLADFGEKPGIMGCKIDDHPRFAHRGALLDVSRHLFPVAAIEKWINILALYKINTFQWHLTDDQGWRIEIKKYPKLQTISAYRDETLIGHKKELPHVFDGKRYGGYYTQDEVKQIVQYAADRHITVIPEIEMPGHALAALAAYPELGCTGGPYKTATFWGIFNDVYCPGNEQTFTFLQNVLDEVLTLFPSKYIHIGGDECPKVRWHECPKCQKLMLDNHLKNENELQTYFVTRIEKYLNSKGRQIIGWDEILEGGLSPGATVMSWTGESGGIAAASQHHDVIMTPEKYVYMDYYQSLYAGEQTAAGGYLPLSKIYNYEPIPPVLNTDEEKYIKGVQANVWSEYLDSEQKAEYMMFPRIFALSEIAWSDKTQRNYNDFLARLRKQMPALKKMGLKPANVFDEITYTVNKNPDGKTVIDLASTSPGAIIHYTTDGSGPGINSAVCNNGVVVDTDEIIKAVVFSNGQPIGRTFQKRVMFHKGVGKKVTMVSQPVANFNPGDPSALVNGIEGSNLYNDGQWFGFGGADLEAVVDLGTLQPIKTIGTDILKYHWQKMWEPTNLTFLVSTDGISYTPVYSQQDFPVNGINTIKAELKDIKARFVKIIAINKGTIPEGEYGAGGKAMLMVDELFIY